MSSFDHLISARAAGAALQAGATVNLSRRATLAGGAALLLAFGIATGRGRMAVAQPAANVPASARVRRVPAYLAIDPNGTVRLMNPFNEGGQGIDTTVAQIVAEELDADLSRVVVAPAPTGPDYLLMFGDQARLTGGSLSTRSSYASFRSLGATARAMLVQAAATRWGVPAAEITTEPHTLIHAASNRRLGYGEVAAEAAALPVPADVAVKDPARFRLIGKPVPRIDAVAKSTGAARYGIDTVVPEMLHGFVLHGPRLGAKPALANEAVLRAMPGVHSVHVLEDGLGVLANSWWRARKAAEAAELTWSGGMSEDFSTEGHLAALRAQAEATGAPAESHGDVAAALAGAAKTVTADYDAPYLAHAQLEPPSCIAAFQADGSLDLHLPNQAPEMYQGAIAAMTGLPPEKVRVHTPQYLGGFFGRHFLYATANVFPEAIAMARASGRPVRVLWSREEEFKRDAYRPLAMVRFRAGLDAQGNVTALHATIPGEGPMSRHMPGFMTNPAIDSTAVEGVAEKPYAIPARRVDYVKVATPSNIGFWRSVGHSMNDFFYEAFLDEVAEAAGKDPYAFRMELLRENPRLSTLLRAVGELSGGWRRGPFEAADGTRRARGVAMASPFGSEVATIAEVSLKDGEVVAHDVWVAIDPGRMVNPGLVAAQVRSAVAIGLSSALLEQVVIEKGEVQALNFDGYPILGGARMPQVHVRIVESGAPMGGVGEPGVPGVPPAVVNAVAALTGQRVRSLPLSKTRLGAA